MKKVLFVIPGCRTGGVLSSLIALLNSRFSVLYDVHIFIMNSYGERIPSELKKYLCGVNTGTSLVYANVVNYKGLSKYILIIFKVIFRVPIIGCRVRAFIESITIKNLEKNNFDCVVSFQESVSMPFVAKFSNPFKIGWIHCDYSKVFSNTETEELLFERFSKIVTVSKYTKNVFCQLLPSMASKVETIYNIMDYDSIVGKAEEPIDDCRFKTDKFTIISVGRISLVKHFDIIPEIASELKAMGGSFRWYIIGGNHENNAYIKLKASIKKYSVDDEVICLGNKYNPYPFFRAAQLLVSTSNSEACPMVFNEAKILGLPIVTTNFGSSSEFITDGSDGHICTIEEMPNCIFSMMNSKKENHPSISIEFDEQYIMSQIDNLFTYEN